MCLWSISIASLRRNNFELTIASHLEGTYPDISIIFTMRGNSHDYALLSRIHLAVLIDSSHTFIEALLGLYFVWEPFLEEYSEFVVEIVYLCISIIVNPTAFLRRT
jgi:hypothetical protein